ncbi:calcium-binding protein [Sphingomonas koreensis]|nr:calcium-binding protein [Sphingomonas koreensis]
MKKFILAAVLAGTALSGAAIAGQTAAPAPPAAPTMHHRGDHGDWMAKLDTNKDGVITRDEAIAAADARFAKMDPNGDGQITKEEMQVKHQAMRAKWQAKRAADGDQAATPRTGPDGKPMAAHHGMRHHRGGHGMMMQRIDANNDGTITRDEARAAATQRFDKMDANHDGRIDQAEMQAMKAERQAKRADMRAKWQAKRAAEQPAGQ